jgi:hypothetical protein
VSLLIIGDIKMATYRDYRVTQLEVEVGEKADFYTSSGIALDATLMDIQRDNTSGDVTVLINDAANGLQALSIAEITLLAPFQPMSKETVPSLANAPAQKKKFVIVVGRESLE